MSAKSMCRRAWRIPFRFAIVLLLPIVALPTWLMVSAFTDYCKYASTVYGAPPISIDIIRLFLHDNIVREKIKFEVRTMPKNAPLQFDLRSYLDGKGIEYDHRLADESIWVPEMRLKVDPHNIAKLNSDLPTSGQTYVPATIEDIQGVQRCKLRYRGDTEPHWLYRQKSLRVKLRKGRSVFGTRRFNLINYLTPIPFIESIAQRMATEAGLLAPRCFPVRVFLNERYYGLLLFYDQVDETFLRNNGRMPGSIFRGDINFDESKGRKMMAVNPKTGVGRLWENTKFWVKDASRNAEAEQDTRDLDLLLEAVNSYDQKHFIEYCETYLDNKSYATFLALNMFTGSPHHDFTHNHKLYFDPYRGKFEVISWDDKGFYGIKDIDPTLNPLANRWRQSPLNEHLKYRRLWKLLNSTFSVQRVLGMLVAYHEASEVAIRQDENRDMIFIDTIFNKLSRPYLMETYRRWLERIVGIVQDRDQMLRAQLEDCRVRYSWKKGPKGVSLDLAVMGPVGASLKEIELGDPASGAHCFRDSNLNGTYDTSDEEIGKSEAGVNGVRLVLNEALYSGLKRVEHDKPREFFGNYKLQESPLIYRYFLLTNRPVSKLSIKATNLVTGDDAVLTEGPVPGNLDAETISVHPWQLIKRKRPHEVLILGPGVVRITATRVFDSLTEVHILPGTRLELGRDVSVFFEGRVIALGTEKAGIRFEGGDAEHPWGVVAVLGEASHSSVFKYCSFSGGSDAERNLMYYSGMVSIRNSSAITFEDCFFGENFVGDDSLHFANSEGRITNCEFKHARSDAFDADFSTLVINGCRFLQSGNDGLDLMTSSAVVRNCEFSGSGDKGASIGERTCISIENSSFENCHIGVEVKDESKAVVLNCTISGSETPVNLYRKNLRYLRGGTLVIDQDSAGPKKTAISFDKRSTVVVLDAPPVSN